MPLIITPTGDGFAVVGEIDAHSAPAISAALAHLPGDTIMLDLSGVEFVDSSGLRVLIEAHQRMQGDGGSLVLARPSGVVRRLFDISGVTDYFTITD
jgi:anti-sigma B factor antagonist